MARPSIWGGDSQKLQAAVEAAFGSDNTFTAAQRLLGWLPLTETQREVISRCSAAGQYRLWYRPEPVGHYCFHVRESRGHWNEGWVQPGPHTDEVRAEMARLRSLYEEDPENVANLRRRLEDRLRKMGMAARPIIIEFLNRLHYVS